MTNKTDNPQSFDDGQGVLVTKLRDTSRSVELPESWVDSFTFRGDGNGGKKKESPSSLINFINCPMAWFADRHAPTARAKFVPTQYSVAGDYAHRCLELFYGLEPTDRTEDMLEDIMNDVLSAMTSGELCGGIIDANMIWSYNYALDHPFGNSTKGRVADFIREAGQESAWSIFSFENPQEVDVVSQEAWSNITVNGITFNGKTDRVDEIRPGARSVVDYKTGKFHGNTEDLSLDDIEFFKSGMYSIMEEDVLEVRQMYLKEQMNFRFRATPERQEFIRRVIDTATQQMNEIEKTGQVTYRPMPSGSDGHCRYCPIRSVCPAWSRSKTKLDLGQIIAKKEA